MFRDTNSSSTLSGFSAIHRILFASVLLLLFVAAENSTVKAQIAPKDTGAKKTESNAAPRIRKPRIPRTRSRSPEDSYNFLVLGDWFWEKGRWSAAEAAYRESVRLYPGSEANAALKELHEATRVK